MVSEIRATYNLYDYRTRNCKRAPAATAAGAGAAADLRQSFDISNLRSSLRNMVSMISMLVEAVTSAAFWVSKRPPLPK